MLWTFLVVLLIFWLLGFAINIGSFVHLLLILALVLLAYNIYAGRRVD